MIDATMIDPRIDNRRILLRQAFVLLVILALMATGLIAWGKGLFSDDVGVSAQVDNIGGALMPGADVKVRGVIVGRVASVQARDGGVRLGLKIDGDAASQISKDVSARILPASVFGTTYVDLAVPEAAESRAVLVAGQVIDQDRRESTLELQDTLDNTYRVMTAVKPAELSMTLGAMADALDGRGEQIGATMETFNSYLGRLDANMPLVKEDLALLATNLETLAKVSPVLFDAVDSSLVTARTVVAKRAQITSMLSGGTALADEVDRLLVEQEKPIVDTIRQSAVVVDALYDHRAGVTSTFRGFVLFARKGATVFAKGPWMATDVLPKTGEDAPYTAKDCPVFGPARADNCDGASSSRQDSAEGDDALLSQIRGMLSEFDDEVSTDGGVGQLLVGPFVEDAR